jgi:hypothetical protein
VNADDFPHGRGVEFGRPDVAPRFQTSPEALMGALEKYAMACGALGATPEDAPELAEQEEYVAECRAELTKHVVALFGRLAT